MNLFAAIGGALWLGILTSISPCPMATNIAAISFIGRKVDRPGYVLATGVLYTLGRMLAYAGLGMVLVNGLMSMPGVSQWLSRYMHKLLGPLLIVTGMFLLELITFSGLGGAVGRWCQARSEKFGLGGALLLGVLFALSFCPVSAALFFGSLIPLSIERGSGLLLPLIYGLGTALPVFGFGLLIALGANSLARAFEKVTAFEKWARRLTGFVFIMVGFYFSLRYTLGVF